MPSGHAYAKALRTVKTCVGSRVVPLRHAGLDAAWASELERALWRMYAPHKVKLAVSGCPRNCAESGIKDVGVIGVDSGWEIYVAGNGGIKTEVGAVPGQGEDAATKCSNTPAPSCSSTARKGCVSRAHRALRVGGSASTTSRSGCSTMRTAGATLWERLQFAARRRARSLARAWSAHGVDPRQFIPHCRERRRRRRSRRRARDIACLAMDGSPAPTTSLAGGLRADRHPAARRAASSSGGGTRRQRRGVPHRRRSRVRAALTAARTRADRCRRASSTAIASPARCTTGTSSLATRHGRRNRMKAARARYPVRLADGLVARRARSG